MGNNAIFDIISGPITFGDNKMGINLRTKNISRKLKLYSWKNINWRYLNSETRNIMIISNYIIGTNIFIQ